VRGRRRGPPSLATRLAIWYATSAFGLLVAATGFLYWKMAATLDREELALLTDRLYTLRVVLATRLPHLEDEVEEEWAGGPGAKLFVRVLDEAGATLAETRGMTELGLLTEGFPEVTAMGEGLGPAVRHTGGGRRVFELRALRLPFGGDAQKTCVAQIASDRTADEALLAADRRRMGAVLAAGLVACALGGFGMACRGLRPVSRIGATLRRIRSTTLHERIETAGLPAELLDLASTSNEMLDGLDRAFRQLSRFSADIAHELRTPIHNLRGEVEVALARPRTPQEYRDLLASCLEECVRLSRLIDSLLLIARAEGRSQPIRREQLELEPELEAVAEFYEPLAAERGVELRVSGQAGARAHLDRALVQSAVGNLIENAIAATERGGSVRVTGGADAGGVRIDVSDTGRGIPADQLPRVFERLYQVDVARAGAAGLGLSIVKSIATLHGGSVSLSSEVGVGTRVSLWFPAP
jgi:two-component system heavy metal sensor histidine kinase CusS